jgi:hypothetical protein
MRKYLIVLGAIVVTVSIVGGGLYLSASYDDYQRRLQALAAPAGSPLTMMDLVKWQFARVVGTAMLVGGVILGSVLMGLGWIGKTLEEIRDTLASEPAERASS